MRRALLATLALLALPAPAQAGFFPAEPVEGPNADIADVGDLDIARDGGGLLAYTRRDGGVEHVVVSRFEGGSFAVPQRADDGLSAPSSQPVVAAQNEGRLAVAYVNGGALFVRVKPKGATDFSAPTQIAGGGVSNPSIDMSVNGVVYVSWTQGGDVRAARANRDSTAFNTLPAPMDVDPAREAGATETTRSRVVVSADGSAVVVWGEEGAGGRTHVYARRLFELRLSAAPQDLTLSEIDGRRATDADSPEIDIEDDSSYAQVVFRQDTEGGPRVVARRLVGSQFEPHIAVDSGATAVAGDVDLTGRGEGLFAAQAAGGEVFGATLWDNKINFASRWDGGGGAQRLFAGVGENEDGGIVWLTGGGVQARYVNDIERPQLEPEAALANPAFGPVDASAGLAMAPTRHGDLVVVFVQGTGGERRIVHALYDKAPGSFFGLNTTRRRRLSRLIWTEPLNLLGPTKYRVLVDEEPIGESDRPRLTVPPGLIEDGDHRWRVLATDQRGQVTSSRSRELRVDNTEPVLRVGMRRRGRVLSVSARAADSRGRQPTGLSRVVVVWGDGSKTRIRRRAAHRYRRRGTYEVRVIAFDRGANRNTYERRIRIG
jgi:hypothetical protein